MADANTILEIETLRRLYAKATDLLGSGNKQKMQEGRAIYHRIYTPDVDVRTAPADGNELTAKGPDAWADVVEDALAQYSATQHLIGTQLVEIDGDTARMESYLSAWHARADNSAWIFIGTYVDLLKKTDDGWRIHDMTLVRTAVGESPAFEP